MSELHRNGILTIEGDTATITFKRRLSYAIETVWAALTEPEQRAKWFGATTIDLQTKMIEMTADGPPAPPDKRHVHGRILVWDPPHVLEHEWQQSIVEQSTVRYELTADGAETILTLIHRGLSVQNAKGFIPGLHAYLDRLEAQLAGADLPNWMRRYGEVAPAYG